MKSHASPASLDSLARATTPAQIDRAEKNHKHAYLRAISGIFAAKRPWIGVFSFLAIAAATPALAQPARPASAAPPPNSAPTVATQTPATPVPTTEPTPLGTLFFTPKQRAILDAQRKRGVTNPGASEDDEANTTNPILRGFVRRSDGKTTAWLGRTPHNVTDEKLNALIDPTLTGAASAVTLKRSDGSKGSAK